jgi:hypothetical protein
VATITDSTISLCFPQATFLSSFIPKWSLSRFVELSARYFADEAEDKKDFVLKNLCFILVSSVAKIQV